MSIGIELSGDRLIIGDGAIDTNNRYLRQVANPADAMMAMVEGGSMLVTSNRPGNDDFNWRYECGSLTFASGRNPPGTGFALTRLIAL
ncbi:MAG: hypothetical protein K2X41_13175 [Hyphomicrobium sp.]|nr:hypothetical protein [Hyphomicrobium sp.]